MHERCHSWLISGDRRICPACGCSFSRHNKMLLLFVCAAVFHGCILQSRVKFYNGCLRRGLVAKLRAIFLRRWHITFSKKHLFSLLLVFVRKRKISRKSLLRRRVVGRSDHMRVGLLFVSGEKAEKSRCGTFNWFGAWSLLPLLRCGWKVIPLGIGWTWR